MTTCGPHLQSAGASLNMGRLRATSRGREDDSTPGIRAWPNFKCSTKLLDKYFNARLLPGNRTIPNLFKWATDTPLLTRGLNGTSGKTKQPVMSCVLRLHSASFTCLLREPCIQELSVNGQVKRLKSSILGSHKSSFSHFPQTMPLTSIFILKLLFLIPLVDFNIIVYFATRPKIKSFQYLPKQSALDYLIINTELDGTLTCLCEDNIFSFLHVYWLLPALRLTLGQGLMMRNSK